MGRTVQEKLQIEQRRQEVGGLYLKGSTQAQIARELGVAQSTVSVDLKAIRREWRDSRIRDFNEAVAIELKKLVHLERSSSPFRANPGSDCSAPSSSHLRLPSGPTKSGHFYWTRRSHKIEAVSLDQPDLRQSPREASLRSRSRHSTDSCGPVTPRQPQPLPGSGKVRRDATRSNKTGAIILDPPVQ